MRKLIVILVVALLVSGCATRAGFKKMADSWLGAHVDTLVSSWGPPHRSYPLSDGGQVLEYTSQRNIRIGGYTQVVPQTTYHRGSASAYGSGGYASGTYSGTSTTYVQRRSPAYNVAMSCVIRFAVSESGYINAWNARGNDCKAKAPQ